MRALTFIAALATSALTTNIAHSQTQFGGGADLRYVLSDTTGGSSNAVGWLEPGVTGFATFDSQRLTGRASARAAYRLETFGEVNRDYTLDANANVRGTVIRDTLFVNAGGVARQFSQDLRGFVGQGPNADNGNEVQVFSGFLQPQFNRRLSQLLSTDASYSIGFTAVDGTEDDLLFDGTGVGLTGTGAAQQALTSSFSQSARVGFGMIPYERPLGVRANGSWVRERIDQLDQLYRAYTGTADAWLRVTRSVTLLGTLGYEDIVNAQDQILFDPVTGFPVIEDGDFVVDPADPRDTVFETDGLTWSAGFRYVPNDRISLTFTGGERFGTSTFNGSFSYTNGRRLSVVGVYAESLSSFGRGLQGVQGGVGGGLGGGFGGAFGGGGIGGGGTQIGRPPLGGTAGGGVGFGGCLLGIDPITGRCSFNGNQSVQPGTFQGRQGVVTATIAGNPVVYGASAFYTRRGFVDLTQLQTENDPDLDTLGFDADEQNIGVRGFATWNVSSIETLSGNVGYSYNEFALTGGREDSIVNANAFYARDLGSNLRATASTFVAARFGGGTARDSVRYGGIVGVGYQF